MPRETASDITVVSSTLVDWACQPNSPITSGHPLLANASRYEVMLDAVLNTSYMWMDSTVLCWVSASSTVCALSRNDLMLANELVWLLNQVCSWLTPRMMNVEPLASTMLRPLTCSPTAAAAGRMNSSTDAATASRATPMTGNLRFMTYLWVQA